ncbi:MAG: hypothetical protein R3A52_32735 [Polyangiales bacterium]
MPASEAAWMPPRVLTAVIAATGVTPAPSAPDRDGDAVRWSLVTADDVPATRIDRACDAVTALDARLACATDRVVASGSERGRVVVGWRVEGDAPPVSWAQPLRALSRFGEGMCLVSAQRTLRTLDLTVRAQSPQLLSRALAVMATAPRLSDLILVRAEPEGEGLRVVLSWPLSRARDPRADLGDDAWPTRCDGAATVAGDAATGTVPTALEFIAGARAQGALMSAGRAAWAVTVGDRVGGSAVSAIDASGVTVQMPRRARPVRLRYSPATP